MYGICMATNWLMNGPRFAQALGFALENRHNIGHALDEIIPLLRFLNVPKSLKKGHMKLKLPYLQPHQECDLLKFYIPEFSLGTHAVLELSILAYLSCPGLAMMSFSTTHCWTWHPSCRNFHYEQGVYQFITPFFTHTLWQFGT